ncbi:MAG: SelB C-terminal domain-containing protein, partial [Thermanaerothrix sp.]|nr:SelB C-terminal domain-containing protein [Thermanaerothrix sp.]
HGIVVLTKIDLVDDPEWLDLIENDIRYTLRGTTLQDAPIVRVSAHTRFGLNILIETLERLLVETPSRPDLGKPRLPVDRVFSIAGFGTVVTGTLIDGCLNLGDEIEILPQGIRGRIRGLQTHKKKTQRALPGSRTAVNIAGIEVRQIQRGDVITLPGLYQPTQRLDVHCRLTYDAHAPLQHNSEVKVFVGSSEVLARVRVLGAEAIHPGEEGWLQLETYSPLVVARGDRFILRRPSPGETIGGGTVLEPHSPKRYRRFDAQILERLSALNQGTPDKTLWIMLQNTGPLPLSLAAKRAGLTIEEIHRLINDPAASKHFFALESVDVSNEEPVLFTLAQWQDLQRKALTIVEHYHHQYPLRTGIPREALRSQLRLSPSLFQAALREWLRAGLLREHRQLIAQPHHEVRFNAQQAAQVEQLLKRFAASPYTPPPLRECLEIVGQEVLNALIENKTLIAVSDDIVFRRSEYQIMIAFVISHLKNHPTLNVAEFRDHFQTSRRYALAFLEHLDTLGITQRNADARVLTSQGETIAQTLTD